MCIYVHARYCSVTTRYDKILLLLISSLNFDYSSSAAGHRENERVHSGRGKKNSLYKENFFFTVVTDFPGLFMNNVPPRSYGYLTGPRTPVLQPKSYYFYTVVHIVYRSAFKNA